MVFSERQMDARRAILGDIDAAEAARDAAIRPAYDRNRAELDRLNAKYTAAVAAQWDRYRAEVGPIKAPFDERIRALRAELDAVSRRERL